MLVSSKRILWFSLIGALGGAALGTWLGPKYLVWYFDPPVNNILNCSPAIAWALRRLQWIQLIGTALGVVGGILLGVVVFRKKRPESIGSV